MLTTFFGEANHHLLKINLNRTTFGETHSHNVLESLRHCTELTELKIAGHNLAKVGEELYDILHGMKNLKYLDISDNGYGDFDEEGNDDTSHFPIQKLIMGSTKLEHVNAKGNPLCSEEVEKYIDALHINASVIKLDLTFNIKIDKSLATRLKTELGHNKGIRKEIVPFYDPERDPAFINLTNRMISNLIPFEKFMLSWSIVNVVDLSWNRINDEGLTQLVTFFSKKVRYLKKLNLSSNLFGKKSAL